MPLDASAIKALKTELEEKLVKCRIDKVQQPTRDSLILSLRGAGGNYRLLLSAGTGNARIHLTGASYENPQSPPMFCMLLRKHIQGARISAIVQPEMERLLLLELDAPDEFGTLMKKSLVIEMISSSPNIILVGADGCIIDCLRRVNSVSGGRQVLPGLLYRLPPAMNKPLFFSATPADRRAMWEAASPESTADKWLLSCFAGLSPLICRELCYRCFGEAGPRIAELGAAARAKFPAVMDAHSELVAAGEFTPYMLSEGGKHRDFSFMQIMQYENAMEGEAFESFSALLDAYFSGRDRAEHVRRSSRELTKTVKNATERLRRKLENQKRELEKTGKREIWRRYGDLITANMYRVSRGDTELSAEDYYEEGNPVIRIPLDPTKSPQQNAAKYFKDYSKAKTAEKYLRELIGQNALELEYLESVAEELELAAGESELAELRFELEEAGYLKRKKAAKREKTRELKPARYMSGSGHEILVGRSNIQNDALTGKIARRTDYWFHAQKIHGSHVILRGEGAGEEAIREAATLAAYFSQGRGLQKVSVDYTRVMHVKKPRGARPGMVNYTEFKTIVVSPDEELVERLKVR